MMLEIMAFLTCQGQALRASLLLCCIIILFSYLMPTRRG